jgi:hypothetical protein
VNVAEEARAPVFTRQLGHANSAITQRLYSHEFDRRRDGERRREEYRARNGGILAGNDGVTPGGNQSENEPPARPAEVADLSRKRAAGN